MRVAIAQALQNLNNLLVQYKYVLEFQLVYVEYEKWYHGTVLVNYSEYHVCDNMVISWNY
jgi:hypothetical protein